MLGLKSLCRQCRAERISGHAHFGEVGGVFGLKCGQVSAAEIAVSIFDPDKPTASAT
jgi:hypothetical protein